MQIRKQDDGQEEDMRIRKQDEGHDQIIGIPVAILAQEEGQSGESLVALPLSHLRKGKEPSGTI